MQDPGRQRRWLRAFRVVPGAVPQVRRKEHSESRNAHCTISMAICSVINEILHQVSYRILVR